jgi:hypothetical protein
MFAMHQRQVALFLIGLVGAIGAQAQGGGAAPSATGSSAPATAQRPVRPVGIINFYGLRQLSADQLRSVMTLKVGDSVTLGDHSFYPVLKQELMGVPGVLGVTPAVICCDDNRAILYVGIEEENAPTMHFRTEPTGSSRLPPDALQTVAEFDQLMMKGVLSGHAEEDDSEGHALLHDAAARPVEDRLITIAQNDLTLLRQVLRDSADPEHRAVAALLLGYASDMQSVVPDLVYAMSDSSGGVRNNAIRALLVFSSATKVKAPRVPYEPFIALLDSPVWTDRNKASGALLQMVRNRDPELLKMLRQHALPSLLEMAHWSSRGHAFAAFVILGVVAGVSDNDIYSDWSRNDLEPVIKAALGR